MKIETEFLILGGGVTGLAAAVELGTRAIVVEREPRPGGLVQTVCFNGFWFDRVVHVLHFRDSFTEHRIREIVGTDLLPCTVEAWVECSAGVARYPLQLNLGALDSETCSQCLSDLIGVLSDPLPDRVLSYDEFLLQSFGRSLCEMFYFPYNRKVWKRPLSSLVPLGQSWNLLRPQLSDAIRGAIQPNRPREAYNTNAFYPRPPVGAAVRGMEVLSSSLAKRVKRLHLNTEVTGINLDEHLVEARVDGQKVIYHYSVACLSTLPLPTAVKMCSPVPAQLLRDVRELTYNLVTSVAISVRGPRPSTGHWRYYPDEELIFTRLSFPTEFDPLAAPDSGWGVLVEVPYPSEGPRPGEEAFLTRVRRDLKRARVISDSCHIIDENIMVCDPAYVVFTSNSQRISQRCRDHLARGGVSALGRYGRWEYSSMAQVIADGFKWAADASCPLQIAVGGD